MKNKIYVGEIKGVRSVLTQTTFNLMSNSILNKKIFDADSLKWLCPIKTACFQILSLILYLV